MFFRLVISLNVLVYGGCHLVREEENVAGKRSAVVRTTSPNCAAFANGEHAKQASKFLLQEIDKVIRHRDQSRAQRVGAGAQASTLAASQSAFLYIHGTSPGKLVFDSDYVQRVFSLKELLPFVSGYWPTAARTTNFLLAVPDAAASGVSVGNAGHAEKNILVDWPKMSGGYLNRHNNVCPCYVVLGTVKTPCNFDNNEGCAVDYVAAKRTFTASCPNTRYYLFVDRKPEPQFQNMWRNTQRLLPANGIGIFTNFT